MKQLRIITLALAILISTLGLGARSTAYAQIKSTDVTGEVTEPLTGPHCPVARNLFAAISASTN